jgi:hypothetical protein
MPLFCSTAASVLDWRPKASSDFCTLLKTPANLPRDSSELLESIELCKLILNCIVHRKRGAHPGAAGMDSVPGFFVVLPAQQRKRFSARGRERQGPYAQPQHRPLVTPVAGSRFGLVVHGKLPENEQYCACKEWPQAVQTSDSRVRTCGVSGPGAAQLIVSDLPKRPWHGVAVADLFEI